VACMSPGKIVPLIHVLQGQSIGNSRQLLARGMSVGLLCCENVGILN
jgi:hypothetical protein